MAERYLLKKQRLCGSLQIRDVFKHGEAFNCAGARLLVLPNSLGYNRFLCTFKRGFGNAVLRNRVRRIAKEHFRLSNMCLKQSFDLVMLVFSEDAGRSFKSYLLIDLLKKANMLMPNYNVYKCFN